MTSSASVASLKEQGFVLLPAVLGQEELLAARAAFEALASPAVRTDGSPETGTRHIKEVRASPVLAGIDRLPAVMAIVEAYLPAPIRIQQCGGRDPLPGFGAQGLHTDWPPRVRSGPPVTLTMLLLLDDMDATNGSTRYVPGTHLLCGPLPPSLRQPAARHPDERRLAAPAGSAFLFDGHLWHGGTLHQESSLRPRRIVQCQYVGGA